MAHLESRHRNLRPARRALARSDRGNAAAFHTASGPTTARNSPVPFPGLEERKMQLLQIQPGKATHNGHVEGFNGRLRDERANAAWFRNLGDAE